MVSVELEAGGAIGRGEAAPIYYRGETAESALAFLERVEPPDDPFALEAALAGVADDDAAGRCALDGALHDWVGRKLGVPVWRLLGLSREATPVTSYTIGIDSLEGTRGRARRARKFRALKVKVGGAEDLVRLEAVRAETGAPMRVDANEGWTLESARELLPALGRLGRAAARAPIRASSPRWRRRASGRRSRRGRPQAGRGPRPRPP